MTKFVIFFIAIITLLTPVSVSAYYNNMPASVVIGQPNFTSGDANQGGIVNSNTLNAPQGVYYDPVSKKVFVSDTSNHRVLIFNSMPTENNQHADVVIGQPDFSSNSANQGGSVNANTLHTPRNIEVDNGKLFITDQGNHRVLIFNSIPSTNNASADVVVGQPDLVSNSRNQCGCGTPAANTLSAPNGLDFHQNKMILVDGNNRVLIFNSVPSTNNASADVVLGQATFTTNTSGTTADTFSTPIGIIVVEGKLIIGDVSNFRALVWNTIPTENKTPADVVIGQPDFVSNGSQVFGKNTRRPFDFAYDGKRFFITHDFSSVVSVRNNGVPTTNFSPHDIVLGEVNVNTLDSSHLWEPRSIAVGENKLLVADSLHYHRILIFENILSTPQLDLNHFEAIGDNKIKISGNVHLGEVGKYTLNDVRVSVDGGESKFVTHIDDPVTHNDVNISEWYHEFTPENLNEYTLKITSSSHNAEDTSLFYFNPFNLNSVTTNNIVFSVPKDKINLVKDNISHFEIFSRINDQSEWTKLGENISTDKIDEHGTVSVNLSISGEIKVVSVSKNSNWRQDSNSLTSNNLGSYINPNNYFITNSWFPLQINSITGVTKNILSSFAPSGIDSMYKSGTKTPTFTGIAFNNSKVAMRVTNSTNSDEYREYFATSTDSNWSITPTLYSKSVINLSVYDNFGNYNQILPLTINLY